VTRQASHQKLRRCEDDNPAQMCCAGLGSLPTA
jgi:hypothetical protein